MNLLRPPAICTSKKGTFARLTIEERTHKLIADIVSTNSLVESNINKLNNLDQEISTGVIGDPEQYFFSCNLVPNEWKAWETAITPLILNFAVISQPETIYTIRIPISRLFIFNNIQPYS